MVVLGGPVKLAKLRWNEGDQSMSNPIGRHICQLLIKAEDLDVSQL